MNYLNKKAFTLVELIVVITILAILGTIGFISFFQYQVSTRDAIRVSDISTLSRTVELARLGNGVFPTVTNGNTVTYSGSVLWTQGTFGVDSHREAKRISEVPTDPLTKNEYAYSTTEMTGEYQLGAVLENGAGFFAMTPVSQTHAAEQLIENYVTEVRGSYNGQFLVHSEQIDPSTKRLLVFGVPSILTSEVGDVTIEDIYQNRSFVLAGKKRAPGNFRNAVDTSTQWEFDATELSAGSGALIFSGTPEELSTGSGKLSLLTRLQDYYRNTNISNNEKIGQLLTHDVSTQQNNAIKTVNTLVQGGVGGLDNHEVEVTEVVAESSGGSGGGINCLDMTPAQLADLNGWVNIDPNTGTAGAGTSSLTKEQWCALDTIYANRASLTHIPSAIGMLVDLEFLDVRNNSITSAPAEMANLQKVVWLNFFKNQLPEIPDVVYEMDGVETLAINHNAILTVDPEIKNMDSLRVLYLTSMGTRAASGSVQVPPIEVSQISTLRELYMANNEYTSVPDYLSNLTDLTAFHIYNNNLSGLSPTMCSFIASRGWSSPSTWTNYTGNYRDAGQDTGITNLCPPAA